MAGKQSFKNISIEELLEALCFYDDFLESIDSILEDLTKNREWDHQNDKLRYEALSFLLAGFKHPAIPDDVSANMHAAATKLNSADILDSKDDGPRADAVLKLSVLREKAFNNRMVLEGILKLFGGRNDP